MHESLILETFQIRLEMQETAHFRDSIRNSGHLNKFQSTRIILRKFRFCRFLQETSVSSLQKSWTLETFQINLHLVLFPLTGTFSPPSNHLYGDMDLFLQEKIVHSNGFEEISIIQVFAGDLSQLFAEIIENRNISNTIENA